MKYNIGDLFVYDQSKIGIITEYHDKDDVYTIEWMHGKKKWNDQLYGHYISWHIRNQTLKHFPVK